ncbi:MAG TPA: mechanosensitive ion channel domain-containing protein [Vicinamibacterales bacterium]|nr:mechanosensitive ion channel domain-containing protein [Vicinamibacterales bacterium]
MAAASRRIGLALTLTAAAGLGLAAQEAARPAGQEAPRPAPQLADVIVTVGAPSAVLRFNNRPITTLRATVFGRPPAERAAAAAQFLDRVVQEGTAGTVSTRLLQGFSMVSVGSRDIFSIAPQDADQLTGETLEGKSAETVTNLQRALDEAVELRTPRRLLVSAAQAILVTILLALGLLLLQRMHRGSVDRLLLRAEHKLEELSPDLQLLRASRATALLRRGLKVAFVAVALFFTYNWLTFVLRRFPYTRPWGESLREFLTARLEAFGLSILQGIPNLFTVLLIVLVIRFFIRLSHHLFQAVEDGRISLPYVYPETAQPTRRLVSILLWLLALALSYPYLPGSESDAFKGVSVFVGLVVSLGSSGIVNQIMSGLTITYSRALRLGDFVKIGDVEGTVTHVGALSTKVKTPHAEDVTIPNAVVVSHVTTNYSRFAETEGVYVPTSITIGYDTPWRQVQALLLLGAARTAGVRKQPKPVVRQTALQDFYVQYTLLVCLEQPHLRAATLDALHGNILDAFNEFGVQITSPNYEADPEGRKIVPQDQWYSAPAAPPERMVDGKG